jgi:acyl carrier protein
MSVPDLSMEAYVLRVLREQLLQPDLRPTSRLLEDGILDSLAFVDLIVRIESDLDLRLGIEETDLQLFATPSSIAEHLEHMRRSRGGGQSEGAHEHATRSRGGDGLDEGPVSRSDGRGSREAGEADAADARRGSEPNGEAHPGVVPHGIPATRLLRDGAVLRG